MPRNQTRADLGADGEKTARLVDDALTWALKNRELTWTLSTTTQETDGVDRGRVRDALSEHQADEVAVHDAPLVQTVYTVLEIAADEAASADGWLTAPRMWERVYTTADPAAVVAAATLRTLSDAAHIPDEDELTDANCWFTLQGAGRLARTAAALAARRAA